MSIYTHKHHIIPRHMGGTDDAANIVEVTVEQHALLHKQLWEDLGYQEDYIAWRCLSGAISSEEAKILAMVVIEMMTIWMDKNPTYKVYKDVDYHACLKIAYKIGKVKGIRRVDVTDHREMDVIKSWKKIV